MFIKRDTGIFLNDTQFWTTCSLDDFGMFLDVRPHRKGAWYDCITVCFLSPWLEKAKGGYCDQSSVGVSKTL